MKAEVRGGNNKGTQQFSVVLGGAEQNSISGALKGCLGNLDGACTEKLLLHCASALETNDVTLAQQVMWVLNNVASPVGDPNQRLTSWFLRALISRVSRDVCPPPPRPPDDARRRRLMTVTELAGYVDLIPWHRFGFCASNSAILKAVEGYSKVHIVDFSITHCMQWPTLIDSLAKRPQGPPSLRISVVSSSWRPPVPPFLNVSTEEVGHRLSNFAKIKHVPFEFNSIRDNSGTTTTNFSSYDLLLRQINPSNLIINDDEALVVNCQNWLRYLPDDEDVDEDEMNGSINYSRKSISFRDAFLDRIKDLGRPCIVTVVDEDSDLGSLKNLTSRIRACFNYLWIPFDALETFLPKDSSKRLEYEADIGHKIENIIGFERMQERLESGIKLSQRMRRNGFVSVPFTDDTVREVKFLLAEHASGWGMKKEDDDMQLVLTWKGHNSIFATAWVPC